MISGKQIISFNPIALRKAKIAYNFGLSECNRVKGRPNRVKGRPNLFSKEASRNSQKLFPFSAPFMLMYFLRFHNVFKEEINIQYRKVRKWKKEDLFLLLMLVLWVEYIFTELFRNLHVYHDKSMLN